MIHLQYSEPALINSSDAISTTDSKRIDLAERENNNHNKIGYQYHQQRWDNDIKNWIHNMAKLATNRKRYKYRYMGGKCYESLFAARIYSASSYENFF